MRSRLTRWVNTRRGVERIIRAAFEWAKSHHKPRVCMSDKANVLSYAPRSMAKSV